MKAIYASKMYRNNKNKDKIKAALDNPINKELVMQLREYLDEPELLEQDTAGKVDSNSSDISTDDTNLDTEPTASRPVSAPPAHNRVGKSELDDMFDTGEMSEELDLGDDELAPAEGDQADAADTVEECTAVTGTSIKSASCINCINLVDVISEIKGMLNLRQDTAGVNRILNKDNELWVYYNDSVNLNNVMGTVIELLNASGYTYLDFNRLARTDNAIVFQISILDSNNLVEPVRGVDDGK